MLAKNVRGCGRITYYCKMETAQRMSSGNALHFEEGSKSSTSGLAVVNSFAVFVD